MRLILVRHAETAWNHEYRVQGQTDIPLNESGRKQVELIARSLKGETLDAIFASPLKRTLATAEAINRFHRLTIEKLAGLKELDTGDIDGIYYSEIGTHYPEFYQVWVNDAASARLPGGESLPELQRRVWDSIQSILQKDRLETVVVVSHFFALISLLCQVLDMNLSDMRRFGMSVGSISVIDVLGEMTRLTAFNDICHLHT